jgi:hypothetical protein
MLSTRCSTGTFNAKSRPLVEAAKEGDSGRLSAALDGLAREERGRLAQLGNCNPDEAYEGGC